MHTYIINITFLPFTNIERLFHFSCFRCGLQSRTPYKNCENQTFLDLTFSPACINFFWPTKITSSLSLSLSLSHSLWLQVIQKKPLQSFHFFFFFYSNIQYLIIYHTFFFFGALFYQTKILNWNKKESLKLLGSKEYLYIKNGIFRTVNGVGFGVRVRVRVYAPVCPNANGAVRFHSVVAYLSTPRRNSDFRRVAGGHHRLRLSPRRGRFQPHASHLHHRIPIQTSSISLSLSNLLFFFNASKISFSFV